jgi:hypothetical protein
MYTQEHKNTDEHILDRKWELCIILFSYLFHTIKVASYL